MKPTLNLFAAAVFTVQAQNTIANTMMTWYSTSFISEEYNITRIILYGSSPVTPVPTFRANISITRTYLSEPTISRNINHTTWTIPQVTVPVETRQIIVYATTPLTVSSNQTATATVWVSPTLTTVTFASPTCTNGNGIAPPNSTVTRYTGSYTPVSGQATTVPKLWPTAVTTFASVTVSYRVFAFTGSTVTFTSTATGTNYLSTTTIGTTTVHTFRYTHTLYATTLTMTRSDFQLAYTTSPLSTSCDPDPSVPATVTLPARCAPTNLISSDTFHRGVSLRVVTADWVFPIGFPDTILGIPGPGMDASRCCQLCDENRGCAVSEWTRGWNSKGGGACRLFFYVGKGWTGLNTGNGSGNGTGNGNATCGPGEMEWFGDAYALEGQGSFVQTGCGKVRYLGGRDPFCPDCKVD